MLRGLIRWLESNGYAGRIILLTRNPGRSEREFGIPCMPSHDAILTATQGGRRIGRARLACRGVLFLWHVALWKYVPTAWHPRLIPSVTRDSVALLADCEAVIVHGSGSFNSVFWRGWLYPKSFTAVALHWLGVPLLMTSQGIGPFHHLLDRWMARRFLRLTRFSGVRDGEASRREAIALGTARDLIVHTGDDSALLPTAATAEVDAALAAECVPRERPLIGVNFRDAASYASDFCDHGHVALAGALDRLIEVTELQVVFLPISYDPADDDRASAERIVALMKHPDRVSRLQFRHHAGTLRGIAGRMTAFVGASYHALLFALSAGVPVLALTKNPYYAAKQRGLLEWFGCPEARIDMTSIDVGTLADRLIELVRERDGRSAKLEAGQVARTAIEAEGRSRLLHTLRQLSNENVGR